jgi:hypothetical protein
MVGWSGDVRAPLSQKSIAFFIASSVALKDPSILLDPIGQKSICSDSEIERMRSFGLIMGSVNYCLKRERYIENLSDL